MQNYKSERQRQLDNVQKEILTNYYLQKYNTIMSEITKQPENHQPSNNVIPPKEHQTKNQRMNFKNMILMKKNQNQNMLSRQSKIAQHQPEMPKANIELVHKFSSREEQENQKTMRKLEESIINELYRPSPSKLEQGNYIKLEISSVASKYIESTSKKAGLEPIPQENIEITYEEQPEVNQFENDEEELFKSKTEEQEKIDNIKEAIRNQFDRRKDKSSSPLKRSDVRSSKISVQIKIESPKRLQKSATPNKYKSNNRRDSRQKNDSMRSSSYSPSSNQEVTDRHQVHFLREGIEFMNELHDDKLDHEQEIKQEEIEFVPPSSNYYKSQNLNLVEESFKYQEEIRENRDQSSEKAQSIASSRKSSKQKYLMRNESKKSIRSRRRSEMKDSSRMEMSFVSKISMLSSDEGLLIKQKIEKQLYDNELGPYQSALFNVVELMEKHPRSGPVYAVGQKTLDDRRSFEERRMTQQHEIAELRKNIEKIKRKASQIRALQQSDKQISSNQLQILRLIRKISTNL